MLVIFASFNCLKDLKYVLMLSPVAMGALVISTITLIVSIPFNTDNINSSFFDFPTLTLKDLLAVVSINGFAFICHPTISPIIKENENQKKNDLAIFIGYGLTVVLYILVGVLGALAIFHKPQSGH